MVYCWRRMISISSSFDNCRSCSRAMPDMTAAPDVMVAASVSFSIEDRHERGSSHPWQFLGAGG